MMNIDINCDLGESFGHYTLGNDAEMMTLISSANIACGFHAGDPSVMRQTIALALQHGLGIGAHPGFNDLAGFGRRNMHMEADELRDALIYQLGALHAFVRLAGATLQHVKPHGAMYNMAANDVTMARTIVNAVREFDARLIFFGLPGSKIITLAQEAGLRVAREVFIDRAYNDDGSLVPRTTPGAVITDPDEVAARVVKMVSERKVTTITGTELDLEFETICVHGDTPGALEHVKHIVQALKQAGMQIVPAGAFLP